MTTKIPAKTRQDKLETIGGIIMSILMTVSCTGAAIYFFKYGQGTATKLSASMVFIYLAVFPCIALLKLLNGKK